MAVLAGNVGVFTIQVERRQVVVKFSRIPAFCGVTGFAGSAEATFVRLIFCMAGGAVCGKTFIQAFS